MTYDLSESRLLEGYTVMYDGTVNGNKTSAMPGQCDGGSSGAGDDVMSMTMTMTMTMTMPSGT